MQKDVQYIHGMTITLIFNIKQGPADLNVWHLLLFFTPITPADLSTCIVLLGDVLRSVEALLCRLTGETWQNQDLSFGHDTRECEPQTGYAPPADANMCYTQVL